MLLHKYVYDNTESKENWLVLGRKGKFVVVRQGSGW